LVDQKLADACVRCGLCKTVCPTYAVKLDEAYSPRGRIFLVKALAEGKVDLSPETVKRWDECTLCRNCELICPNGVDYKDLLVKVRKTANDRRRDWVKLLLLKPLTLQGSKVFRWLLKAGALLTKLVLGKRNTVPVVFPTGAVKHFPKPKTDAGSLRGKVFLPEGRPKGTLVFFPGCMFENFYTETAKNAVRLLQKFGYRVIVPDGVGCCGGPHLYSGFLEDFSRLREKNERVFRLLKEKEGAEALVVICPTGGGTFKEDYGLPFPVYELVEILLKEEPARSAGEGEPVTFHYPCHSYTAMGLSPGLFDEAVEKLSGRKPLKGELNRSCCGFAGVFSVKNPELSQQILRRKMEDFEKTGAGLVLTSCPGCVLQLTEGAIRYAPRLRVEHLVDYAARKLLTEREKEVLDQLVEELRI